MSYCIVKDADVHGCAHYDKEILVPTGMICAAEDSPLRQPLVPLWYADRTCHRHRQSQAYFLCTPWSSCTAGQLCRCRPLAWQMRCPTLTLW